MTTILIENQIYWSQSHSKIGRSSQSQPGKTDCSWYLVDVWAWRLAAAVAQQPRLVWNSSIQFIVLWSFTWAHCLHSRLYYSHSSNINFQIIGRTLNRKDWIDSIGIGSLATYWYSDIPLQNDKILLTTSIILAHQRSVLMM